MPIRTMRPRMGLVAATVAVLCLPAIGQDVDFKKLQTLPAFVKAAKLKELPEQTEFETAETYVRKILASGKDAQLVVDLETSQPGPPIRPDFGTTRRRRLSSSESIPFAQLRMAHHSPRRGSVGTALVPLEPTHPLAAFITRWTPLFG